jgi:hypothetical protein
MKKLLLFVILLYAFASQAQTGYAVIAAEDVNFRKSPETTSEVIRMVKLGTLAKVLEGPVEKNSKNWYKIQIGSQVGWMAADFVFELYQISDLITNVTSCSGYSMYVATTTNLKEALQSGMMFDMVNFLVLSEDSQLSMKSKVYPVRIKSDAYLKNLKRDFLIYRDKYLSFNPMFGSSKIIFCDRKESGLGAMVLVFQGFTHNSMYSMEFILNLTEGLFDASVKQSYSNLPD